MRVPHGLAALMGWLIAIACGCETAAANAA